MTGATCISWSWRAGSKSSSRSCSSRPRVLLPVTWRSFSSFARISFLFRFFSCFSSSCFLAFSYGQGAGHGLSSWAGPLPSWPPPLTLFFRSLVSSRFSFLRSSLRRTEDAMLRG